MALIHPTAKDERRPTNISTYMHYLILCKAHCIIQIVCSVLYGEYDIIHYLQLYSIWWQLIWNLGDHCQVRTETGASTTY